MENNPPGFSEEWGFSLGSGCLSRGRDARETQGRDALATAQAEYSLPDDRSAPKRLFGLYGQSCYQDASPGFHRLRGRCLFEGLFIHAELHAGPQRDPDGPVALAPWNDRIRRGWGATYVRVAPGPSRRGLLRIR